MGLNYYEVLGVPESASREQIRTTYRHLVQQYHPDRNGDNAATRHITARLNEAYTVLSDERKRAAHDAWLRAQRSGGGSYESPQSETWPHHDFGGGRPQGRQTAFALDWTYALQLLAAIIVGGLLSLFIYDLATGPGATRPVKSPSRITSER